MWGLERKTKVGMDKRTVCGLERKTKDGIEPKPHALDVNENKTRTTTLLRGVEK
jgi:hypothetical protein